MGLIKDGKPVKGLSLGGTTFIEASQVEIKDPLIGKKIILHSSNVVTFFWGMWIGGSPLENNKKGVILDVIRNPDNPESMSDTILIVNSEGGYWPPAWCTADKVDIVWGIIRRAICSLLQSRKAILHGYFNQWSIA